MSTALPDATELAALVRSGQASPAELVDEAIGRVERLDPAINAVIHERFDADVRAAQDSFLCESIRGAGFITLGRTNTPELGGTITTEAEAFGPSRNPWNLEHSTGGSSGGSAAAVAAGMVPMAHASDGG